MNNKENKTYSQTEIFKLNQEWFCYEPNVEFSKQTKKYFKEALTITFS